MISNIDWLERYALSKTFLGVLTVFKGLIYYFQPHESFNNIGYVVKIEYAKVEFIPLGTKMPNKYCQDASDKQCITYFDKRQVIGFTKY